MQRHGARFTKQNLEGVSLAAAKQTHLPELLAIRRAAPRTGHGTQHGLPNCRTLDLAKTDKFEAQAACMKPQRIAGRQLLIHVAIAFLEGFCFETAT